MYLESCCRVCLVQEHIMIYLYDRVEEYDMTLSQLLETCCNLKIPNSDLYTKLICKECTEELLMVAKFRDKCRTSEKTLVQLMQSLSADELEPFATHDDKPAPLMDDESLLMLDREMVDEAPAHVDEGDIEVETIQTESIRTEIQTDNDDLSRLDHHTTDTAADEDPEIIEYMIVNDDTNGSLVDEEELFNRIIDENAAPEYNSDTNDFITTVNNSAQSPDSPSATGDDDDADIYYPEDNDSASLQSVNERAAPVQSAVINHHCTICGAGFMHMCNLRKHMQSHYLTTDASDATNDADDDGLHDGIIDTELTAPYQCDDTDDTTMILPKTQQAIARTSRSAIRMRKPQRSRHRQQHQLDENHAVVAASQHDSFQPQECNSNPTSTTPPPASSFTATETAPLPNHHHPHQCPHCERHFPTTSLLSTHVRVHTGERPFACDLCPKAFGTRGGLDLHVRRHMGVKPFVCSVCDRRFVESSNLRVHMRTHTGEKPHRCNRCARSFSRVFLLQIHQRTHTGERPYACDDCGKAFAQQGDLAAHRRIHTGERPHRCPVCGRGFIKSSALRPHMRTHTKHEVALVEPATVASAEGENALLEQWAGDGDCADDNQFMVDADDDGTYEEYVLTT